MLKSALLIRALGLTLDMIELRTFEGTPAELSAFTRRVWQETYAGRMPVPLWDEHYFDWQLLPDLPAGRDYTVVAYENSTLVGCLLGQAFRFRLEGREFDATMGGWLTVDPAYRRHGLATRLFEEQQRRHLERGAAFNLGFTYLRAAVHLGHRFWQSFPESTVIMGRTGFWARVLDPRAVARWDLTWFGRLGARAVGWFQSPRPRPADTTGIRPYRPDDIGACVELAAALLGRVDMGYVWSAASLARQLSYRDVPRTVVLESSGRAAGFVNYYPVDFLGRSVIRAAIIDVVALGQLPVRSAVRLLRAALGQMADEGVQLALLLRLPCFRTAPLLAAGFTPLPRDLCYVCALMDSSFSLAGARNLYVHLR